MCFVVYVAIPVALGSRLNKPNRLSRATKVVWHFVLF